MERGMFWVITASVLFGLNPILISRVSAGGMDTASLVFWMYVINCGVNILVCGARRTRAERSALRGRRLPLLLCGMVGMGWTGYLLTMSYGLIGTGISTVLHFMYPAFVSAVMILVFKERADGKRLLAMGLSVLGVGLVTKITGGGAHLTAFLPALLSGVTYGSYLIINGSRFFADIPLQVKCTYMSAGVWISFGILLAFKGGVSLPGNGVSALMIVIIGCSSAAAYNALVYGVGKVGASKAAFATLLEPLTSLAVSMAVNGEMLTARRAAGSAVILLAVFLNGRSGEERSGFKRRFFVKE